MTGRKGKTAAAEDPAADAAAGDLEILFPDVTVTVTDPDTGLDTEVTVREFRFLEGLEAQAAARPLAAALAGSVGETGAAPSADGVMLALTDHAGVWIDLLAKACDRDPEWVGRLRDTDGDRLSTAMWDANRSFFTRAVLAVIQARQRAAETRS
ncbi:MAG: hypothetical protein OXF74_05435 [Rhodobacteraceae bacterium]|nr:hypothetical protein [Paracoccaceae bacterium]